MVFVEKECHSASRRKVELAFVVGLQFLSDAWNARGDRGEGGIASGGQEVVSRREMERTNCCLAVPSAQPAPGEPNASLDRDYQ